MPTAPELQARDTVLVTDGPFADLTGPIRSIDRERRRALLVVQVFGDDTLIDVLPSAVGAVSELSPAARDVGDVNPRRAAAVAGPSATRLIPGRVHGSLLAARRGLVAGSCPASWCRGSSVTRSGTRPCTISAEAAAHEEPC
ncbi:KOW motif-containing protein [Streptomyces sp. NPDC004393]